MGSHVVLILRMFVVHKENLCVNALMIIFWIAYPSKADFEVEDTTTLTRKHSRGE